MRVSEFYSLGRTQPSLPFVDVDIANDVRLFVNARAIRSMESDWAEHSTHLLETFFRTIIDSIRLGDGEKALEVMLELSEPNETHLGLSRGKSEGRGLGPEKAKSIWKSLSRSKAVKTGLLSDLEDTVLLIDGVSVDIFSDIVTNIIRGPLITFTQTMCMEYDIPMEEEVDSGPVWNPNKMNWDSDLVRMPVTSEGKLLLVPKSIVRIDGDYDVQKYYRHFVLERLKSEELKNGTSLVHVLKSGKNKGARIVYKKDVEAKYGKKKKSVAIKKTDEFPDLLQQYKAANSEPTPALTHRQLSDAQGSPKPNWQGMIDRVKEIEPGKESAYVYEDAIQDLLTALFHPVLVDPVKQVKLHHGLKRVDLTFTNYARSGFFEWLAKHYNCSTIFIECKNYGSELGNPEIDQIAMRFSKQRGEFGIVVCRKIKDRDQLTNRCRAAAIDQHGYVVALDDEDLSVLVGELGYEAFPNFDFPTLKKYFDALIM